MNIGKKQDEGCLTLKVEGRLDTNTAPELESELELDGVKEVVFDFSELEYISSAGLRVLMVTHKTMAAATGAVKILHPNATVLGVFGITGLDSVFTIEQ